MTSVSRAITESFRGGLERRMLRASRRAYASVSGHRSPVEGLDGWLEELRWGLDHLDEVDRLEADRRVLTSLFFGSAVLALLRSAARVSPHGTARAIAHVTPRALRWLVGDASTRGTVNRVPSCTFRRKGGERLCEQVCRRPTEQFCAERLVPLRMQPEPGTLACTWTWGSPPDR